ncbi:recombinase family protein [Pseudarthrobacter sp. J64]|uniref:recombinase family protein n=1 Tax=Pseudarthrobacter sp. J64 TaxID=3116485 RepID=UPI003FA69C6D
MTSTTSGDATPNIIGYARVSSTEQGPRMQLGALSAAGSSRIFMDAASGRAADRPYLREALADLNHHLGRVPAGPPGATYP